MPPLSSPISMARTRLLAVAAVLALSACGHQATLPESQGHIGALPEKAKPADIPPPVTVSPYVPPPKPAAKPQTFAVVVNEIPVKELLFALARDSGLNVDVHPGITGVVTMNAVDETLPALLDRISRQVSLRYRVDGNTLTVTPDLPYFKTYRVDYVNVARNTSSKIGVAAEIATTGAGTLGGRRSGSGSATGAQGGTNSSNTTVDSVSRTDFWSQIKDNISQVLRATKSAAARAEERAQRQEAARQEQEERLRQAEAVSRAGPAAPSLFSAAFGSGTAAQAGVADEVVINPAAGTVAVFGTDEQHRLVSQYLDKVSASVQRQVLIEATIVEVDLANNYQAGIDWSRLSATSGFTFTQRLANVVSPAGSTVPLTIGFGPKEVGGTLGVLSATIDLLETFGNTKVLSSPKLMALNNQTALLKVVDNEVYFTIEVDAGTVTAGGIVTAPVFTSTVHTVPVGVVMSVTPQISDGALVSLIVRPTITSIVKFAEDPNPALKDVRLTTPISNQIPVLQVREMESVLQVASGQTAVLGGLMQDKIRRGREGVPVLSTLPGVGDVFSYRNDEVGKTELVIFLRPVVITNASLDSEELRFFQRFLPRNLPPTTTAPPR